MYYSNELIDELEGKITLDRFMYVNIQAHNVAKMLKSDKSMYKLFGVYWWAVKDALRKYVSNDSWYCGKQNDPLMKERTWHGNDLRTMIAAMFYMNENFEFHKVYPSDCLWHDKDGNLHRYTLFDSDAGC